MAVVLTSKESNSSPYAPEAVGPLIVENRLPGCTFNNGLLRFHNEESGAVAQQCLFQCFGESAVELTPFAFDWLGRHYCRVQIDGQDMAVRTDSAFQEASVITDFDKTVIYFLEVDEAPDLLDIGLMERIFERLGVSGLKFTECIGFKIPPFLGGTEEISNFELNNIDVYWTFNTSVYDSVKHLPPGTPISGFEIDE